jgi:hypothetical protein
MKELKPNDYSQSVQNIFHLLSVKGEYRVIGSAKYASIKYKNDYDLEEYITKTKNNSHYTDILWKVFKEKFYTAENNPKVFITDFKCGVINGIPVRWNKQNIRSGKQKINGKLITFQKCLLQKAVIKLDVIAIIDGVFSEFTENYYFKLGNFTNYNEKSQMKQEIQISLLGDAKENYDNGKLFKAVKRLFAFFDLKNIQQRTQQIIIDFFNSDVGLLHKSKTELDILILVLQNTFRKPSRLDVINNMQLIKQNLSSLTEIDMKSNISETIDLICKRRKLTEIKEGVDILISYLQKKVNEYTMSFLQKNKILLTYII